MSPNIQLNLHSKKLFLQHTIDKLSNEDGILSSTFFKLLLINNAFIQVARLHHLYSFDISFNRELPRPYSYFLSKTFDFSLYSLLNEAGKIIQKMIQFLKPTRLNIRIDRIGDSNSPVVQDFVEFVKQLQCKISLFLNNNQEFVSGLLNSWSPKLSKLRFDEFPHISSFGQMDLEYCRTYKLPKHGLIRVMSLHKIKTLEVAWYPQCTSEENSIENSISNNEALCNVENLKIQLSFKNIEEFINTLSARRVELKSLEMRAVKIEETSRVTSVEEVLNYIDGVWLKLVETREQSRQITQKLVFNLTIHVQFTGNIDLPENWIQRLMRHEMLKNCEREVNGNSNLFISHIKDASSELSLKVIVPNPTSSTSPE